MVRVRALLGLTPNALSGRITGFLGEATSHHTFSLLLGLLSVSTYVYRTLFQVWGDKKIRTNGREDTVPNLQKHVGAGGPCPW